MAQVSIFDKQRHHSDKDITISVGAYDRVYITLRNKCWERLTKDPDYIRVWAEKGTIYFGSPNNNKIGKAYKLSKKHEIDTRYVVVSADRSVINAAKAKAGSYDVPKKEEEQIASVRNSSKFDDDLILSCPTVKNLPYEIKEPAPEPCNIDVANSPAGTLALMLSLVNTEAERIEVIKAFGKIYGGAN